MPWCSQGNNLFEALSPPNWFIPVHYDARVRGTLNPPLILPATQMVVTPVKAEIHVSSFESQEDRVYDAGCNTAASTLADICRQTGDDGYIASTWVSTDTDSDLKVYNMTLTLPTIGSATHAWSKVVVEPGCSWEVRPDGVFATLTFSSALAEAVTTRL